MSIDRSGQVRALDLLAFCREDGTLEGELPLADMSRLVLGLLDAPAAGAAAHWSARGELRPVTGGEPEIWLHLLARAGVTLQCQRCLKAMAQDVLVDRRFRFVHGEDKATALDEQIDDDVLALPARLDLIELLEDELILALPLVPRHAAACPEPLPLPADDPLDADGAPNPFAVLASLRKRGPEPDGR